MADSHEKECPTHTVNINEPQKYLCKSDTKNTMLSDTMYKTPERTNKIHNEKKKSRVARGPGRGRKLTVKGPKGTSGVMEMS